MYKNCFFSYSDKTLFLNIPQDIYDNVLTEFKEQKVLDIHLTPQSYAAFFEGKEGETIIDLIRHLYYEKIEEFENIVFTDGNKSENLWVSQLEFYPLDNDKIFDLVSDSSFTFIDCKVRLTNTYNEYGGEEFEKFQSLYNDLMQELDEQELSLYDLGIDYFENNPEKNPFPHLKNALDAGFGDAMDPYLQLMAEENYILEECGMPIDQESPLQMMELSANKRINEVTYKLACLANSEAFLQDKETISKRHMEMIKSFFKQKSKEPAAIEPHFVEESMEESARIDPNVASENNKYLIFDNLDLSTDIILPISTDEYQLARKSFESLPIFIKNKMILVFNMHYEASFTAHYYYKAIEYINHKPCCFNKGIVALINGAILYNASCYDYLKKLVDTFPDDFPRNLLEAARNILQNRKELRNTLTIFGDS